MEEDEMTHGIDRLAELLAERGIEFCVGDRTSLVFMDGVGNLHECWMAGAEENLVNVCITITPEQALSVRDLNGIVSENAKLRELVDATTHCRDCKHFTPNDEIWAEPPLVPISMIVATCDTCDFWANTKCKVEPDGSCAWGEPRIEAKSEDEG